GANAGSLLRKREKRKTEIRNWKIENRGKKEPTTILKSCLRKTSNCDIRSDFARAKVQLGFLASLGTTTLRLRDEGKFDAFAHGVDAVGADAHAVAEVPLERTLFGRASGAGIFRRVAAGGGVRASF